MSIAEILHCNIAVGELIVGEGPLGVAVDIFIPTTVNALPVAFFCMPGGGLNKAYYHLDVEGEVSYSFAQHMAERGYITIAIDHLGVGESSRPRDGFALTPEVLIAAGASAVEQIKAKLQLGTLNTALPPLPQLHCVGVGHSMGGLLTVLQQAEYRNYDAIAILGFGTRGRPEALSDDERPYINDSLGVRANVARLVKLRGLEPYFELNTRGQAGGIYGGRPDRAALNALGVARADVLAIMAFFAMIPGSSNPECEKIDVPILIVVGDSDITGPAHLIPGSFIGSADVTLVVLPNTGHTHFIFPTCVQLYQRLARWTQSVLARDL